MSDSTDTPAPATDPVTEAALSAIESAYPDAVEASELGTQHPWIRVKAERLRDVARLLRDEPSLRMDCCHLVSGVDWPKDEQLEAVYHLCSFSRPVDPDYKKRDGNRGIKNDAWVCLKVRVPRERPEVPTVMDIWIGADWHERETYDLVGIEFTGRRELQRVLLPEDWPGHPLRKDWQYPADYHGIPIVPPEGL